MLLSIFSTACKRSAPMFWLADCASLGFVSLMTSLRAGSVTSSVGSSVGTSVIASVASTVTPVISCPTAAFSVERDEK